MTHMIHHTTTLNVYIQHTLHAHHSAHHHTTSHITRITYLVGSGVWRVGTWIGSASDQSSVEGRPPVSTPAVELKGPPYRSSSSPVQPISGISHRIDDVSRVRSEPPSSALGLSRASAYRPPSTPRNGKKGPLNRLTPV